MKASTSLTANFKSDMLFPADHSFCRKKQKKLRRMEITYTQIGDYLYPNITLCEDDKLPIGKYGRMRKEYLREHRPVIYNVLAVQGKLQRHLWEIDQAANERLERMIPEMKKQAGITEQLKAEDQMAWVGQMNALKQQAEEIIFAELIYC